MILLIFDCCKQYLKTFLHLSIHPPINQKKKIRIFNHFNNCFTLTIVSNVMDVYWFITFDIGVFSYTPKGW
jgi:hypothetical protein